MGVYNEGNIKVKVGSATVLGYGTTWTSVYEDYLMKISDSSFYTVASVLSATRLTISPIYQNRQYETGNTINGARYYIVRDYTDNFKFPEITNDNEDVMSIYTHAIRMIDEKFTYVNEDFTVIDGGLLIGTGNGWSPYDFGGHIGISNGNASNVDDDGNVPPVDPGDDNTGEDDDDTSASTPGGTPIDPPGEPPTEVDNYEDSLVCWLKLDETTGNIAYDSSASSINASVIGTNVSDACWVGTNPKYGHNGKGWRAPSGRGCIKCNSAYQSTFRSSFTLMGWMSAAARWPDSTIVGGTRNSSSEDMVQFTLGVWTNPADQHLSQPSFYYYANNDDARINGGNIALDGYLSPLTHYAIVVTENEDVKMYINGAEVEDNGSGYPSMIGIDMSLYDNDLPLVFGGMNWGVYSNPAWQLGEGGVMADFRLYSTALTQIQVQSICRQDELAYKRMKQYAHHARSDNDVDFYKLSGTISNTTYHRWGKYFDQYYLWNSVDLPKTAVVRDSAMTFCTIYETGVDIVYSYLEGENTSNATAIQNATDADSFSTTASSIGWHLKGPSYVTWDNGDELVSNDVHSLITQVTERSDWDQGDNIHLRIRDVSASSTNYQRTWRSTTFSTVTNTATFNTPKLYINYAVATTAIVPGVATLSNTYLVYPMNENTGQIITNNGYSGYTGNLLNVTASPLKDNWATGIDDGYAVVFNATMETYIDANDSGAFADELYNGPFTICQWMDQDDGASSCAYGGALGWMPSIGGAKGHRPAFIYGNDKGKLFVDYRLTSSSLQDVYWESADTVFESGQTDWTHLTVTVTGNDYIKVYKNAALQTANATHNGYIPMSTSNFDASSILPETFFGCYNHHSLNDTDHFSGKMDQVRIYTLRLEQQEIQDIYDVHKPAPLGVSLPSDSNLVLYYKLDETTGTTASDEKGSYDGTFLLGPGDDSQWVTGQIDNGLLFDGVDDWLRMSKTPIQSLCTSAFSMSFWIKSIAHTTTTYLFGVYNWGDSIADGFFGSLYNSGDLQITYRANNNSCVIDTDDIYISDWTTEFHHVVITNDGTTMKLYLDAHLCDVFTGVSDGSMTTNSVVMADFDIINGNSDYFAIGTTRWYTSNTTETNAIFDDIRFYDIAITADNVTALYQDGS